MAKNAFDVAGIALASGAPKVEADINVVAARGLRGAGKIAYCYVVVAGGVVNERTNTDGCVLAARGIVLERTGTISRVVIPRVVKERTRAESIVEAAGNVGCERG